MDLESPKWVIMLIVCWLYKSVNCNSVEQKIYVELNNTVPCVRLLNATHQIGCQSSISGDVGVIHVLESEEDLDWVLTTGTNPPYMVVLDSPLFTRSVMMKMKSGSSRIAGVAIVVPSAGPPEGFSPHTTCPNENTGVYSESYGRDLANCNTTVWNPLGNGLSYEEFDFPVFSLNEDNQTEIIKKCYFDHNRVVNNSAPQYPLCAMQLYSHMHAVTDTATCMRRNDIFSINPEMVCDPLGDYNVWSSIRPFNNTAKGHKENESVVLASARLDSRSFFWDVATGAESSISGFVTLLAAAQALREVTRVAPPTRNILFAFFQGEAFDYIGSSRMVYDMENNGFVIDLENVHSILEVGQVGIRSGSNLWLHSDPVSRSRNSTTNTEVQNLQANLLAAAAGLSFSVATPAVSQPLPPSSLQRFLLARAIPGIVLTDHQSAFNNKYYESVYDKADNLNLTYPSSLSPEEKLVFVTDTAKALAEVATMVARALYKQADGADSQLASITADPQIVTQMLYGFLIQSDNNWFQALMPRDLAKSVLKSTPLEYYVGVSVPSNAGKTPTRLVQYILANLTGNATTLNNTACKDPDSLEDESKELYSYIWVQGMVPLNGSEREGFCVRASVRLTRAVSPAFELGQYSSKNYSTWTESRWKFIKARIFLVASHDLEMLTLGVGVAVLLTSLLVTYFVSAKAEVLFSPGREPANAAY